MKALWVGFTLFTLSIIIHIVWWRFRTPRKSARVLMLFFFAMITILLPASLMISFSWPDILGSILLYISLAISYIIAYTGIEETSPTLTLIRALDENKITGCTEESFKELITNERFFYPRLKTLVECNILSNSGSGWNLTPQGRRLAYTARFFCKTFYIKDNAEL